MSFLLFVIQNFRWLIVGVLLAVGSSFGQTFFISVFAGDIQRDFGLSYGQWGWTYTVGTVISAITLIWAGVLTDLVRVRVLGPIVVVGLSLSCFFMALNQSAAFLIPAVFLLRFTGQGMMSHLGAVAMARWFTRNRGKALALATLGYALGEATLPLIFVSLKQSYDWQVLWMIAGTLVLILAPLLFFLLRQERTPQAISGGDAPMGLNGRHWDRRQVLGHLPFWLLAPAVLGPSASITALFFLQVHVAEVKGWSHLEIVSLFPVYSGLTIAFTFIGGWAIDRWNAITLMPFLLLPAAVGFLVLSFTPGLYGGAIGFAIIGMTSGMNATVPSAFWAELYGTRHLGAIKAMAAAIMVFGSAIGPGITGFFIDRGIDFAGQMIFVSLYLVMAAGLAAISVAMVRRGLPVPGEIDI